jgi:hypothetical protein
MYEIFQPIPLVSEIWLKNWVILQYLPSVLQMRAGDPRRAQAARGQYVWVCKSRRLVTYILPTSIYMYFTGIRAHVRVFTCIFTIFRQKNKKYI